MNFTVTQKTRANPLEKVPLELKLPGCSAVGFNFYRNRNPKV